jgi:hypothetical protein
LVKTWKCFTCDSNSFEAVCADVGLHVRARPTAVPAKPGPKLTGPKQKRRVIICPDISNGRESIPIPVMNEVDNHPAPVSEFNYIVQNVLGTGVNVVRGNPNFMTCCSCTDNCSDPKVCECALSMAGFAYDRDNLYFADKPGGIYECNYMCSCHKDLCRNRLVGNGPNIPLQVFRCKEVGKGWGVRCAVDIPIGTFIADYLGEVLSEVDAEMRVEADEYLFGMDAFARSHACQVLTDVGLKKVDLPPAEFYSNVANISRKTVEDACGDKVAARIFERPTVIPLIDFEADSNIGRDSKSSRKRENPSYSDIIKSTGIRKRDINKLLSSCSTSDLTAAAAKNDGHGNADTSRKKQLRDARATLMERAMIEAETKNITYTLDAK